MNVNGIHDKHIYPVDQNRRRPAGQQHQQNAGSSLRKVRIPLPKPANNPAISFPGRGRQQQKLNEVLERIQAKWFDKDLVRI